MCSTTVARNGETRIRFTAAEKWIFGVVTSVVVAGAGFAAVAAGTSLIVGYSNDKLHDQEISVNTAAIVRVESDARATRTEINAKLDRLIEQMTTIQADLGGLKAVNGAKQ